MSIKGFLTATALLLIPASASQAMTLPTSSALGAVQAASAVEKVSFWGRAFPYRYNWSRVRACTRFVPVETARGPRLQRIWVCSRSRHWL